MDNQRWMTCSICGFRFSPEEHPGCAACPLHEGCQTVCCPNCGTSQINPERSSIARFIQNLLTKKEHHASSNSSSTPS